MPQRFGQVILLVAALAATGMHWAALQTVAWTGMLANNLRTSTVRDAFVDTFDGKHPCCLCKAIEAGKNSAKKKEFLAPLKQLEFISAGTDFIFLPPHDFVLLPDTCAGWRALNHQPPVPPPRVA